MKRFKCVTVVKSDIDREDSSCDQVSSTGSKEFFVYAEVFVRDVLVERFVCIGVSTRDVNKEIFIYIELIPSAVVIRSSTGFKTLVTTFDALADIAISLTDATNLLLNTA